MNRLKELRTSRGIKQETVANYLKVANGTYSRYENGLIVMTPKTLCKLSKYFDVATDYLIGNIDYPLSRVKMRTLNDWTVMEIKQWLSVVSYAYK